MKSIPRLCLAATAILCLASCIPSLYPAYTDEDTEFDNAIIGEWSDNWDEGESADVWKFTKGDNGNYSLTYTEKGKAGKFKATLFKLGDQRYLDLFPEDPEAENLSPFFKWHLLPVHTFLKVNQVEPELQMAFLNSNKLEATVEADPQSLTIQEISERMVMTGPTEELQAFFKKYDKDEAIFDKFLQLTRKKD